MRQFKDPIIQRRYIALLDAVCSWERSTGRDITILVIPHDGDDPIGLSNSGKPWGDTKVSDILRAIGHALEERTSLPPPPGGR